MTIQNGFFKSINGDRRYLAEFFTSYFASFIGNGVFPNPSTNLQVIANQNFATIVRPGKGWINGHYLNNDDNIVINHQPPDGVLRRIDRIVFAVNLDSRSMDIYLKQGTPGTNAQAPALLRNSTIYELALADIAFNPGMTSISQTNITDQRMNGQLCGIVHGVVEQLDTTTLFNQYQQFLVEKGVEFDQQLAVNQETFDTWFAQLNDILDGDVAANLANMIITHTNNATSQKHIEIVSTIPTNLVNKGLLLQIDDVDNPNNAPEIPTSMVLSGRIDAINQQAQQNNAQLNLKVDKISGKQLSTNDYTDSEKQLVLQIPDKANQAFVDAQLASIVSGAPKGTFTDLNALRTAYPDGAEGVFLTLSDGHWFYWNEVEMDWIDGGLYNASQLGEDSVSAINVDFVKLGKNLFDKSKIISNHVLNSQGQVIPTQGFSVSDFILVNAGQSYTLNNPRAFVLYRQDRTRLSYNDNPTNGPVTVTPTQQGYLRAHFLNGNIDSFQVELGEDVTTYQDYMLSIDGLKITPEEIANDSIDNKKLKDDSVTVEKIDFVRRGKNLFNKKLVTPNTTIGSSGQLNASTSYVTSDFIPVTKDVVYALNKSRGFAYYYKDKTFVTGSLNNSNNTNSPVTTTAPLDGYIRFYVLNINLDEMQMEVGTASTVFEPYRIIIDDFINNPLASKTLLNFGDSIAAGDQDRDSLNNKIGYATRISRKNGMIIYNRAVGGATIAVKTTNTNDIVAQVNQAVSDGLNADYILFDGLTNDIITANNVSLGTISSGYNDTLDTSTFSGAFEYICKTLKNNWLGAKIIYVRAHNMPTRDASKQIEYGNRAIHLCEKWSIPVVDMYSEGGINTNIDAYVGLYTPVGDATHPNGLGYDTYFVPIIEAKMKSI